MNQIANAVAPIKQASIDAAVEATKEVIAAYKEKLEAANWDLNLAFPRPNGFGSRSAYMQKKAARDFASSLVSAVEPSYRPNQPMFVRMCEERIARALVVAAKDAAAQYEAYVVKLINKVGECDSAVMGFMNGVWHDSDLVVTKGDSKEVWNTKCIINRSVHGKVFNQFPTRKRK
jgi:hypothetical protein